jgi:hypothetical protein
MPLQNYMKKSTCKHLSFNEKTPLSGIGCPESMKGMQEFRMQNAECRI